MACCHVDVKHSHDKGKYPQQLKCGVRLLTATTTAISSRGNKSICCPSVAPTKPICMSSCGASLMHQTWLQMEVWWVGGRIDWLSGATYLAWSRHTGDEFSWTDSRAKQPNSTSLSIYALITLGLTSTYLNCILHSRGMPMRKPPEIPFIKKPGWG